MIPYASRTGTRRNLRRLRDAGWGLMLSALGEHRDEGFERTAADNGAWSMSQLGTPPDPCVDDTWAPFINLLDKLGAGFDFAVVPDIVCGGAASLALSLRWLPRVLSRTRRALLAVQNGMRPADVEAHVGPFVGVFIGGDTAWKERAIAEWGPWGAARGVWVHVGRVNTTRRIRLCGDGQVASFDGSGPSRYANELHRLDCARRQMVLPGLHHGAPASARDGGGFQAGATWAGTASGAPATERAQAVGPMAVSGRSPDTAPRPLPSR